MEVEIFKKHVPNLVTSVSDNVPSVSDQCLARGLINESTYKKVLESGETSEDRARTLILAVLNSAKSDSRCLEIFLSILEQELPHASREKLLSEIRKEMADMSRADSSSTEIIRLDAMTVCKQLLSREHTLLQSSLLSRYENAIRNHQQACAEKAVLEKELNAKTKECKRLKTKRSCQTQKSYITHIRQVENIKMKIEELQKTIEEQDMQARRNKAEILMEMRKWHDRCFFREVQQKNLKKGIEHTDSLTEIDSNHEIKFSQSYKHDWKWFSSCCHFFLFFLLVIVLVVCAIGLIRYAYLLGLSYAENQQSEFVQMVATGASKIENAVIYMLNKILQCKIL